MHIGGDGMKLFDSFTASKELIAETKFVKIYKLNFNNKEYHIIITKRLANKRTIIRFIDDYIEWEQLPKFPRLAGGVGEKTIIYKFDGEKVLNTMFVVKGTPLGDEGLDNGIFRSTKKYDENFVNCMTYKKFKKI